MKLSKALKFIKQPWFVVTLLTIVSLLLRLWNLGKINEFIFDEVYFVKFAQNYLSGTDFFDIHPPLGKLIIAAALKIFSDTTFVWRLMPAIFGTLLIPLGYFVGKEISSKTTGILTAVVLALDGMLLVYSRVGLIDIFLSFFILLGFYFFLKFANDQKNIWLILAGLAVGLAGSVKYIGFLTILIYIVIIVVKKLPFHKNFRKYLAYLILIPAGLYLGFFIFNFPFNKEFLTKVIEWHNQSFNYNLTLKDTHPYGSKWWTWFLLLRPIWLYYKDNNGQVIGVFGMGNPLAWWSSLVIIPMLVWGTYKKYQNHVIILGAFLIYLLFWAPFNRVLFYYHALPSFVFLSIGIAMWLERLLKIPYGKYYLTIYLALLLVLFVYFLPLWLGLPISSDVMYKRLWLKGWI